MPSHTIHVERDAKAAAMLKAYLSNRVGIGNDVREEMKGLDTCNMSMIRIPTFQATSLSPMSAFSSVAIVVGDCDTQGTCLTIRYVHVRDKHQGKGHGASLIQELMQRNISLKVDMNSEDFFNTFEFWISQGFRIKSDDSTETSYRLVLTTQDLPPHPRDYLVQLQESLEASTELKNKVSSVLEECYHCESHLSSSPPPLASSPPVPEGNSHDASKSKTSSPSSSSLAQSKSKKRPREEKDSSSSSPLSIKRPVGRAPLSKRTGEPMVWVDGMWQEALGLNEPGPVQSPGGPSSKVARCSKDQGPRAVMKKKPPQSLQPSSASPQPLAQLPIIQEDLDDVDMDMEIALWDARIARSEVAEAERKAFFMYCNAKRDKVVGGLTEVDHEIISKVLAEKWRGISEERRNKYMETAQTTGPGTCPVLSLQMHYLASELSQCKSSTVVVPPPHEEKEEEENDLLHRVPDPITDDTLLEDECDCPQPKETIPFPIQCFETCRMDGTTYKLGDAIYTNPVGAKYDVVLIGYFCRDLQSGKEFAVVTNTARPEDLPSYPFLYANRELVLDGSSKTHLLPLHDMFGKCTLVHHDPDLEMDVSTLPPHTYFFQTTYQWDSHDNTFVYDKAEVDSEVID